jgi:hypothetical protein
MMFLEMILSNITTLEMLRSVPTSVKDIALADHSCSAKTAINSEATMEDAG